MTLRHYSFPVTIDTSSTDIIQAFFIPALVTSVQYDRGVGYFSSGWLRLTAKGMVEFASKGGRARWVTSPILEEDDWLALLQGAAARQDLILRTALERNIVELARTLEEDTLSALAWMVADDILDFRLALPRNKLQGGEFHDKFGVFTDAEGNQVSFNGSYNESIQGTRNYESLRIFSSWHPSYATLVRSDHDRFQRLWNNIDPNVQVYTLPDAARQKILKLRSKPRPYNVSTNIVLTLSNEPRIPPELTLRDYQLKAVQAWLDNECRGILEMATGTGKTKTALSALALLYERNRRLATIITVPYQHLVDQWHEEARTFGLQPVLCYKRKISWQDKLHQQVLEYNRQDRRSLSVITTHTTLADPDFQEIISRVQAPCMIIADEAHHLGSVRNRDSLPANIPARLALSATPNRWYDDVGTNAVYEYFGDTVFRLDLADAIRQGILVPYEYYPILIELTDSEMFEYQQISEKVAKAMAILSVNSSDALEDHLEKLLFERTRILNSASGKLSMLRSMIAAGAEDHHVLFYCAPEQIDEVCQIVGWECEWKINRFTAEESNDERQRLLADFDKCNVQALVAMKCLDEGVDVPSTRTAYILASSSNPREFVQRRGRVLRRAPQKDSATIYDFIVIPPKSWSSQNSAAGDKTLIERELKRFKEFANTAQNKHQALSVVWDLASQYGIYL